jgi:hypothetical protein
LLLLLAFSLCVLIVYGVKLQLYFRVSVIFFCCGQSLKKRRFCWLIVAGVYLCPSMPVGGRYGGIPASFLHFLNSGGSFPLAEPLVGMLIDYDVAYL